PPYWAADDVIDLFGVGELRAVRRPRGRGRKAVGDRVIGGKRPRLWRDDDFTAVEGLPDPERTVVLKVADVRDLARCALELGARCGAPAQAACYADRHCEPAPYRARRAGP